MTSREFEYAGTELALFESATNWKRYLSKILGELLGARVLEVGAGIGGNTKFLAGESQVRWTCLEPDKALYEQLVEKIARADLPAQCEAVHGSLAELDGGRKFDTVLYIDVLEHIENDRAELAGAAAQLGSDGRLIVLAPAHQWLYSPFDAAIGHFRRYSVKTLRELAPGKMIPESGFYLDCAGIVLSAINKAIVRRSVPSGWDIAFWDRLIIPVSRTLDPLLLHRIGKSVVHVWRKPRQTETAALAMRHEGP